MRGVFAVNEAFGSDGQKQYAKGPVHRPDQPIHRGRATAPASSRWSGPLDREHLVMTPINDFIDASTDQKIRLWVTLIVITLMVALTAYMLSFALLGPAGNPPPHRSAV